MIISRQKYERDLQEAYERGHREAEDRCYRERGFERLYEQLDKLNGRVRKLEGKKDPEDAPFGCPFD